MNFFRRLIKGKAIGAQKGFADSYNSIIDILENMEGAGDITIDRSNPKHWRIKKANVGETEQTGSGIPDGYSEEERVTQIQWDNSAKKLQVKKATVLIKDEDASWTDLLTFAEYDA